MSDPGIVHAPGPANFKLHSLGWRAFQDLCGIVLREVWGQSVQTFADTNDAGRDGAFYGHWLRTPDTTFELESISGPFVMQAKFFSDESATLSLSSIGAEMDKVSQLVSEGFCESYVLISNARITGRSESDIVKELLARGVTNPLVLGGGWLNQSIALYPRLRRYVPRVYGLGDLSMILDERAYRQTQVLLSHLDSDLAAFVITDSYNRAARALHESGFVLLLGEPAVGKSIIAATLAITAADSTDCRTIKVDGAEEIIEHWNPDESQLFWADDAFGVVRHEQLRTQSWAQRMPKVMTAIKAGARVILTSRDYIYREARPLLKEYSYPLLAEKQVVVDVASLTVREREQIIYNHVKLGDQPIDARSRMKDFLPAAVNAQPFRPEIARRLGQSLYTAGLEYSSTGLKDFMTRPVKFLSEVYEGLAPENVAALALVYASDRVAAPLAQTENLARHVQLFDTSRSSVATALEQLEGTFLRKAELIGVDDETTYWTFRHPSLREGFAALLSTRTHLIELVLAGMSDAELVTQLDCGGRSQRGEVLRVPRNLWPVVLDRLQGLERSQEDRYSFVTPDRKRMAFFMTSCSPDFVREYLERDPPMPIRAASRFMASLAGAPEPEFCAWLQKNDLLPEDARLRFLEELRSLALNMHDAEWLDIPDIREILTTEEYSVLLVDVREKIAFEMEDLLDNWEFNEQGDSVSEYYTPLVEALDRYAREFADQESVNEAVRKAKIHIESRIEMGDESSEKSWSRGSYALPTKGDSGSAIDKRSIFDDVDE